MKIYKISNLRQADGMCDYKGLDINKFICGSQIYGVDNTCMIQTSEDNTTISNSDVLEVDQTTYNDYKNTVIATLPKSPEDRLTEVESQNAQMLLTLVNGGLM